MAKKKLTIADLANEAAKKFKVISAGVKYMRSKMTTDMEEELIVRGLQSALYDARHHVREAIKFVPKGCSRDPRSQSLRSEIAGLSLYQTWVMRDGRLLGDYTGNELKSESEYERLQADGHMINSKFYAELAGKIPGKAKLKNKLKADAVQDILDRCKND